MPSQEVRYARLLRPFSPRRVNEALYHVMAESGSIYEAVQGLLIEPPTLPEQWVFEIAHIRDMLALLANRCADAEPLLRHIEDAADRDFQRAVDAQVAIMRGLSQQEWRDAAEPDAA